MPLETLTSSIKRQLFKPFDLLDDAKSKWFLVFFCGLFSTIFILFYNPLNIANISQDTALAKLLSFRSAGFCGAFVLMITQFAIRPNLGWKPFNVLQFLGWVALEILLIALSLFFVYRAINQPLLSEFLLVLRYTALLAIIPYSIACLLIAVVKMSNKIQIESLASPSNNLMMLKDESGKISLSVEAGKILFFKSENNYTAIFFWQNEKVHKKLIRSSLKNIQQQLPSLDFIRIHRSYLVNLQNVASATREKGEIKIGINHLPDLDIKVSDTYKHAFLKVMEM
ncbi:MAG: LytTR family DNA-binding domain-containing protein [Saprospiraceae bacterium]